MRIFIALTLLVVCAVFFGIRHITGSVRHFNVTVTNRAAILPTEGYSYVTDSSVCVIIYGDLVYIPSGNEDLEWTPGDLSLS